MLDTITSDSLGKHLCDAAGQIVAKLLVYTMPSSPWLSIVRDVGVERTLWSIGMKRAHPAHEKPPSTGLEGLPTTDPERASKRPRQGRGRGRGRLVAKVGGAAAATRRRPLPALEDGRAAEPEEDGVAVGHGALPAAIADQPSDAADDGAAEVGAFARGLADHLAGSVGDASDEAFREVVEDNPEAFAEMNLCSLEGRLGGDADATAAEDSDGSDLKEPIGQVVDATLAAADEPASAAGGSATPLARPMGRRRLPPPMSLRHRRRRAAQSRRPRPPESRASPTERPLLPRHRLSQSPPLPREIFSSTVANTRLGADSSLAGASSSARSIHFRTAGMLDSGVGFTALVVIW